MAKKGHFVLAVPYLQVTNTSGVEGRREACEHLDSSSILPPDSRAWELWRRAEPEKQHPDRVE